MLVDKKYLTPEYTALLCIGLLRYDTMDSKDKSLSNIGTFFNYFFTTKQQLYKVFTNVYETDNPIYFKITSLIVDYKLLNANSNISEIRQYIIDKIENEIDNNTFNKLQNFVRYITDNRNSNKFNNNNINIEFDKILKFILLNESINSLYNLHSNFYKVDEPDIEYNNCLSKIFMKYEDNLTNDDFVLDNEEEELDNALLESATIHEECREIDILKSIKFIEKKRIAIIIAASGVGKSMLLCFFTSQYMTKPKNNNKKNVIFYFTFENSKTETFLRILSNICKIDLNQLKHDILIEKRRKEIIKLYLEKKDKSSILVIVELPPKRHNMLAVEACIDKVLLKYKNAECYAIMLDYIDKMLPIDNRKTLRSDEIVGNIADDFKGLSKKYDTCGITVSQFNRDGVRKSRSGNEIASSTDIGGGWSKYENADIVITMQVKDTYNELGYNMVIFNNEKHRYNTDGTIIETIFKPNYADFKLADSSTGGGMAGQFEKKTKNNKQVSDTVTLF